MFLFLNAPRKLGVTCVIDGVTLSGLQTDDPVDDKIKAYVMKHAWERNLGV